MLHFSTWKKICILGVCLLGILFTIPNLISNPQEKLGALGKYTLNLGLDLKGGSYLLLEVNFDSYLREQLENIKEEIRQTFREEASKGNRVRYQGGLRSGKDHVTFTLAEGQNVSEIASRLKRVNSDWNVTTNKLTVSIGFTDVALKTMREQLVEQSVEIIRRRVDETGTREPDIQRQGDTRILLQVPGLQDPEHLKQLMGKTAKMGFHLVNDAMPYPDNSTKPVPADSVRLKSDHSEDSFVVKKQMVISGDLLSDARAGFNQNGEPVVNIRFNNLGAKKFADVTKQNVGKPFAIILDNKVLTAPVIRSVILDGRAEISGSFTVQSATDLSLLLRAGALPAPVNILEERTVGPSLGSDSIKAGQYAMGLSIILIMGFVALVYRFFGVLANIALLFNLIFMVAVLSFFQATLTLPGIAGMILTLGMAVDANVLIYERIKEETRLGKSVYAALEAGFKNAMSTIVDSNLTTLIAAVILFNFGSGPIRGFAVTLSIGILTSMFSAVVLTRLMIVTWVRAKRPERLKL